MGGVKLVNIQCESSSVEECIERILEKNRALLNEPGFIESSRIHIGFGAFMTVSITLVIKKNKCTKKGILVEYSLKRSREDALKDVVDKINLKLNPDAEIVDYAIKWYTTPVTRRTYGVAIVVYNIPSSKKPFEEMSIKERREIIAQVLETFNYNPRVLNVSELARIFGVSRDSIYYDIQSILKDRNLSPRSRGGQE